MVDVGFPSMLYKARFAIASPCLGYAIFFSGFAYGLSIAENMFAVETVIKPDISFSGGLKRDYSDLLMSFSLISVCFLVFLVLTQLSRKLFAEIFSLITVFSVIYFLESPLPLRPGYIPGQTLIDSAKYLQAAVWSDFVFFCLILILIVLQGIATWHSLKLEGRVK